ncbi:YerC/YecD family TrpR-related protein [Alicyclobacillus dauci]|uniref:YerC/YecD family TrpR-related protein n=1 Tax=Alicyclobacillus dauci TaxID=1475485 RepID=A0ABY6Z4U9_9BACL|nr:YerC/YecD family TrpR-related protein [Alicyclobacillus dauci]WAH37876.1 YerC/YecD family TrpR-related protein [Alicyclobacillus dauci]
MALDKLRSREIERLFQAILSLQSEDECFQFFDDLCTIGEIQSLAQRLEVAHMLRQGATYHAIEEQTGASTATISRVKRCLHYGADGYRLILDRLDGSKQE